MALRPEEIGIGRRDDLLSRLSDFDQLKLQQVERNIDHYLATIPRAAYDLSFPMPEDVSDVVLVALCALYEDVGYRVEIERKRNASGVVRCLRLVRPD
jgi:hypothetical protein